MISAPYSPKDSSVGVLPNIEKSPWAFFAMTSASSNSSSKFFGRSLGSRPAFSNSAVLKSDGPVVRYHGSA